MKIEPLHFRETHRFSGKLWMASGILCMLCGLFGKSMAALVVYIISIMAAAIISILYGLNYQKTGKELMSRDELAVMDGNKCILQLRGVRPFLSNKYDITKHKRYKELSDADKRNAFDVEKYLEHKLVFSQNTEFEMYEVNVTEEDVKEVIEEEVN